MALGTINDMWFGWIIDVGAPGPDRGEGGKYLILPPDYDGPLPDSGFHVGRSRTTHALYAIRAFMENNDPKPAVAAIKKSLKIYPYTPGGFGTSIATALAGKVRLEGNRPVSATKFVEASDKSFSTIPPNDFSYFGMLNELVQMEPATSFDIELMGQLAAIGIVKGKPFKPDARMKKILTDAAAIGDAAGRALNWRSSEYPGRSYYPGSMWANMLWQGGYTFETPPPTITKEGFFEPMPPTGARTLDSRTAFYYGYTMDSPGMIMRLPNVGSQYLMGFLDADKNPLDGGKTYKVTLPKDIPAGKFWSFHRVRQSESLHASDAAALPACWKPDVPDSSRRCELGWRHDNLFRSVQADRRKGRQLDPDHVQQGLVHDSAFIQSARAIFYKTVATKRD
jgi:hypothetical protein